MAASRSSVPHLITILMRLYPPDWRARYEGEVTSLLADAALTPSTVLDIALAALDAHVSGDYPSESSDDRKVRHPMPGRIAPLAIVLGGAFLSAFALVFIALGSPDVSDGDGFLTALLHVVPFAAGLLALGIGGVALGRLAYDPVARGLGLLTSALGLAFAGSIFYLFFVSDAAWGALAILVPAFALSTGALGLRLLTADKAARLEGALLSGGLVAAVAWAVGWYVYESSVTLSGQDTAALIQLLGFTVIFVVWLGMGILELRDATAVSAERASAT